MRGGTSRGTHTKRDKWANYPVFVFSWSHLCTTCSGPNSRPSPRLPNRNLPIKAGSLSHGPHLFPELNFLETAACAPQRFMDSLAADLEPRTPIWTPLHSCKKQICFQLSVWACRAERERMRRSITCFRVNRETAQQITATTFHTSHRLFTFSCFAATMAG